MWEQGALAHLLIIILNRKMVFRSRKSVAKTVLQYVMLAIFILIINTLILNFLTGVLGWNRYLAKICTEIFCFCISWCVQRSVIFKGKNEAVKEDVKR